MQNDDAGAMPLATPPTAFEADEQLGDGQLVDTGVNVAEEQLTGGLKPTLRRFCDTTSNAADKARALELLTALELSENIKADAGGRLDSWPDSRADTPATASDASSRRRPRTAAPTLQPQPAGRSALSYVNSYETTHGYYYQQPQLAPAKATRPASSQMQRVVPPATELAPGNAFGDLFMQSTYSREFFKKPDGRCGQERAASARGVRNHNPHPSQEFLVWRYRRPATATERIESAAARSGAEPTEEELTNEELTNEELTNEELTNESFDRAVRGKCRSTYKTDFLGLPSTFDVSQYAIAHLPAPRPKFDKSSTSRSAFGRPAPVPSELAAPAGRFAHPRAHACGVLPANGLGRFGTRARTTYDLHIGGPASRLLQVRDLRGISNAQNAHAVAKLLEGATGAERASLAKLYQEMERRRIPVSLPAPVERRVRPQLLGASRRRGDAPACVSAWAGP